MSLATSLAQVTKGYTLGTSHPEVCHQGGNIVVAGVGEASLAAYMIKEYVAGSVYVYVSDDYLIPEGVISPTSLIIILSLDGEDDAMIGTLHHAKRLGLDAVVITGGGRLQEIAQEYKAPVIPLPKLRAFEAPLFLIGVLTGLMQRICVLHEQESVLTQAVGFIEDRIGMIQEEARLLAKHIDTKLPVIYGGSHTAYLARLTKSFLNIYAKMPAFFGELPVSLYDELAGYEHTTLNTAVIGVRSAYDYEHIKRGLEVLESALKHRPHVSFHRIHLIGNTWLEELLYGVLFAQELAVRLARLHHIDPDDQHFRQMLISETR